MYKSSVVVGQGSGVRFSILDLVVSGQVKTVNETIILLRHLCGLKA